MTWALLGGLLLVTAAFVTQTFLGRKDARELLAARDMLDQEREETRVVRGQLASEEAAHEVTEKLLKKEQALRATAEAERNDAYRRARDYYAERIRNSGVADAIHLVDSILALPLPGVVRDASDGVSEVVPAGDPNRTDDDLLRP